MCGEEGDTPCHILEVKTLNEHEYEPNAAQGAEGSSIYYKSTSADALQRFLGLLISGTPFDTEV